MLHPSFNPACVCLLLPCILTCIASISAVRTDILFTTCKQCADRTVNYDFCLTSLQSVPTSHFINLQGLAVIAMELALKNATASILAIRKMMTTEKFNPPAKECLKDCFQLYVDSALVLMDSAAAFFYKQYDISEALMLEVMDVTDMCEEGFKEKVEVSPLTKENYNLFQLSDIAMCIIDLLVVA